MTQLWSTARWTPSDDEKRPARPTLPKDKWDAPHIAPTELVAEYGAWAWSGTVMADDGRMVRVVVAHVRLP